MRDSCACTDRYCVGCARSTRHVSAGEGRCQCVECGREVLTETCEMRMDAGVMETRKG